MAKKLFFAILAMTFLVCMGCMNLSSNYDKTALDAAILDANALCNGTTVGTEVGDVSQQDKSSYATAIANAQKVNSDYLASQAEIDSAILTLASATTAFKAAIVKAGPGDTIALDKAITDATALCNGTTVGTVVGNVSQADKDAYTAAIASAQGVKDNGSAIQADIDAAITALAQATTVFNAALVTASPVDKTALAQAITDATALIGGKTVGTAVGNVSQADKDAYAAAIASAQAVNGNASATQANIDAAVTALSTATTAFNAALVKPSPSNLEFPYGYVFDCGRSYTAPTFTASSLRAPIDGVASGLVSELKTDTGAYIALVITTYTGGDIISNVALDLYNKDGTLNRRIVEKGTISLLGSDQFLFVSKSDCGYLFSRTQITASSVSYSVTSEKITKKSQLW